ncbi:MAG: hypothetical protein HY423_09280 [Candidatus Lambdaproteobacteria bacterium]|nr:hypothetical protein [Candidatus Lambdaproteobacteria bacterium]
MLEIDYDLIPLSAELGRRAAERAEALARRGKVPPLSPSAAGKVVVVNPNQGYTIHHIPDELRKPLRRMLVPVYSGSTPLNGQLLLEQVQENPQERLYQIVIELHSDFPTLGGFLQLLPELVQRNPRCRLMLHGDMVRIFALIEELIGRTGAVCLLRFDHHPERLALRTPADLGGLIAHLPRYPTLPVPFFSHLRLKVGDQEETFTLEGLKRLYRLYGVGNIDELDVTGKLRERLIVLDLPTSAIRGLRFAANRGETFRAVRMFGEKVHAQNFAAMGLETRALPWAKLDAIYRQLPGREEEEILLGNVRALRVNCFDGHVSFLWKPTATFIPLYELRGLHVLWPAQGKAELPVAELAASGRGVVFDPVIVTEEGRPRFGDVRAGIRLKFLREVFEESVNRQAKLTEYASQLKLACLGPLAAQTLKLLQPLGLGEYIPAATLYYLCDSFEELHRYGEMPRRLRERYAELLRDLKALFSGEGQAVGLELVLHRMPVIREWTQIEPPAFEALQPDMLASVYAELRVFQRFSEGEFRRIKPDEPVQHRYFEQMEQYQQLALRAKQLANLLGGRYGHFFQPGAFPDFVFFGTREETARNDQMYFLPGFAWSEVLKNPESKAVFQAEEFAFSVFLEEQMALLNYQYSQEGADTDRGEFGDRYFGERIAEGEKELAELIGFAKAERPEASPGYEKLTRQLSEQHRADLQAFSRDGTQEARRLEELERRYFDALKEVTALVDAAGLGGADLLGGEDYIRQLDGALVKLAVTALRDLRDVATRSIAEAGRTLAGKVAALDAYLTGFNGLQKTLFACLHAQHVEAWRREYAEALPALVERLNVLRQLGEAESRAMELQLDKQRHAAVEEKQELDFRLNSRIAGMQEQGGRVRQMIHDLSATLARPLKPEGAEAGPAELLQMVEQRLQQTQAAIAAIAAQTAELVARHDAFEGHYRRKRENSLALYRNGNELALVRQHLKLGSLQKMMTKPIEVPPFAPPALPETDDPAELDRQLRETQATIAALERQLLDSSATDGQLLVIHEHLGRYGQLQRVYGNFRRAVKEKMLHQLSLGRIAQRVAQLRQEEPHLRDVIARRMIPAYRTLCEQYFIPEVHKRIEHFQRARAFVGDLGRLSFGELQREFMERAIFRRFHAVQFTRGVHHGLDTAEPLFAKTTNVPRALYLFQRALQQNLVTKGIDEKQVTLEKLQPATPEEILRYCGRQRELAPERRVTYLVLPATLSLPRAIETILAKDAIFGGLPQLVMIYLSSFDNRTIQESDALRDQYFRAVKHNVIIGVDGVRLVDNPLVMATRLLQETLGSSIDMGEVKRPAETESLRE